MNSWVPISISAHSESRYQPRQDFGFSSSFQAVKVTASELPRLLPHYAIGFTLEKDRYNLVALLGLNGNCNHYLEAGLGWNCEEIPTIVSTFPFAILETGENKNRALCISENFLSQDSSLPALFENGEELASDVKEVFEQLQQFEIELKRTQDSCQLLEDLDLLEPWPVKVQDSEDSEVTELRGLFRTKETKLNQLEPNDLAELRDHSGLLIAYGQLFSMHGLTGLAQRMTQHQLYDSQIKQTRAELGNILSSDTGSISFD